MGSSRRRIDRLKTRQGVPTTIPKEPKRHCALCGAVLTWNPDELCCLCRDSLEAQQDRRWKIPVKDYPKLIELREAGWKHKDIARLFGCREGTIIHLVSDIRRGLR